MKIISCLTISLILVVVSSAAAQKGKPKGGHAGKSEETHRQETVDRRPHPTQRREYDRDRDQNIHSHVKEDRYEDEHPNKRKVAVVFLDDDEEDDDDNDKREENEMVHQIVQLAVDEHLIALANVSRQLKLMKSIVKNELPSSIDEEDSQKKATKRLIKEVRDLTKQINAELKEAGKKLKQHIDSGITEAQQKSKAKERE
jgi:hypothetical protein